mmetsp:Transcript_66147/g.158227  ORF Transcript_66147/g.158227 Transcript_66147/m.158227 type:complete len:147 (-) Transcript_66147:83-523(-)
MAWKVDESFADASSRVQKAAVGVLSEQISVLRQNTPMKAREASELLRGVCEELNEMVTDLRVTWQRKQPGQPLPALPVEDIPAEELIKIGWDFHSNRVTIMNTGTSFLASLQLLLACDQSASYAKPPTDGQILQALSVVHSRLAAA